MRFLKPSLFTIQLFISSTLFAQIYSENFDNTANLNSTYTLSDIFGSTYNFSEAGIDYITNEKPVNLPLGIQPTEHNGSRVIAVEDMDGAGFPVQGLGIVTKSININNYSDLKISLKVASTSIEPTRYESSDGIDIQYQLDNSGTWVTVGTFRGRGEESIPYLYEDTELNGSFETVTGPTFREVTYDLNTRKGSMVKGTSLKVRVIFYSEGPHEEILIDDLQVTGTYKMRVEIIEVSIPSCENSNNGKLTAIVSSGSPNYTFEWSNGSVSSNTSDTSYSIGSLNPGLYTVSVTDKNGNTVSQSYHLTAEPDVTPPSIEQFEDQTLSTGANCTVDLPDYTSMVSASDNCDPSPALKQIPGPGTSLTLGITTVTIIATDPSGYINYMSFTVSVLDDIPPMITCPSDTIIQNPVSSFVEFKTAIVLDNCSNTQISLLEGIESGGKFPLGTTTETFQAIDMAGNVTQCTFSVTLENIIGFDSYQKNAYIKLYPNPAQNQAIIESNGSMEVSDVVILDMKGRKVQTFKINKNEREIALNDIEPGIYLIQCFQEDKVLSVSKLVIE